MSLINKNDIPQVAMEFMNSVHDEDVDIINALYDLVLLCEQDLNLKHEEALASKFEEWFEHTTLHFKGEEEKMLELNFPPYPMHKSEHDNALHTMDTVFRKWKSTGNVVELKNYMRDDLVPWLVNHIQTMDTVTAHFLHSGMSPCSTC